MIKNSRSKVTNRPPANRPTRSATATARRVRDLFQAYLERLGPGPHDPIVQAQALRAAELATICEGLRAKALAGEEVATAGITQMEGTAKRAEEAMLKGAAAIADDGPDWGQLQDEADRLAEERRLAHLAKQEMQ